MADSIRNRTLLPLMRAQVEVVRGPVEMPVESSRHQEDILFNTAALGGEPGLISQPRAAVPQEPGPNLWGGKCEIQVPLPPAPR